MGYGLRLVAYQPNGPRLGVLGQHLGFEVGMPLNGVPSLRLTYSTHAAGAQSVGPLGDLSVAVRVSDEGTARLLAQYALNRASGERVQHTRQIRPYAARWLPLKDYRPGDTVLAPGDQGVVQGLRVRQVTLSCDSDGVIGGNLVLNDRFLERDIRLARRSLGILDGGISSGGGGGTPAPDTDGRVPAAPGGLLVEPAAYLDEHGYAHGQATLTWGAVTEDVNAVELSIDGYEVYARRNEANVPWVLVAQADSGDRTATISPLVTGWEYAFKVRATNDGTKGVFSPQFVVLVPADSTPPPAPSTPVVAARLGVIHVEWDGLGSAGEVMPIDLDQVHVWMRDPLDAADTGARFGYLTGAGTEVIPGQPYNADREIWLTAEDRSGNESGQSGHVTVAVTPLVDTDLIGEIINGGRPHHQRVDPRRGEDRRQLDHGRPDPGGRDPSRAHRGERGYRGQDPPRRSPSRRSTAAAFSSFTRSSRCTWRVAAARSTSTSATT